MKTPGLLAGLRTLDEILASGNTKEARGYLSSLITALQDACEHDLQREALTRADVILGLVMATSEGTEDEKQFNAEVEQVRRLISWAKSVKGLLQ